MKRIEQSVLKFIDEKNLIQKDDKILVALSGGPDSVFLLHFLVKYKKRLHINLGALHVNHRLRGKEADLDEKFSKNLSEKLGIIFYSVKKNIKDYAVKNKFSIEEAGRLARYEELQKAASVHNYSKIATAHNSDDNAETVLLNLIKGTGIRGISGIPVSRGKIIRPILCLTKEEILKYLNHYKINFRIDLTNLNIDYERNFIRNKVIPLIKNLNPNFENTILKSSEVFKETSDFIDENLKPFSLDCIKVEDEVLRFEIASLKKVNKNLLGILFKNSIEKKFPVQISFSDCKKLISLLSSRTGKTINLPGSLIAVKERNSVDVFKKRIKKDFKPVEIKSGRKLKLDNKSLLIKKRNYLPESYSKNKSIEFIKGDNLEDRFILRKWEPGDRFYPLGMKGSKKISDFLNEQKISASHKKDQLVLTNNGKIIWVLGLRIDDRFRITNDTKTIYELCLK